MLRPTRLCACDLEYAIVCDAVRHAEENKSNCKRIAEGTLSEEYARSTSDTVCARAPPLRSGAPALSCRELVRTKLQKCGGLYYVALPAFPCDKKEQRRTKLECVHSPFLVERILRSD